MPDDLIPLGVRIAVRNAVGGSGPYTVSGIDDLFNANGFVDPEPLLQDFGGERRTRAEQYQADIDFTSPDQARRYLDVIDEVLAHYPDTDAPRADPGQKLRRELSRAGIVRDSSGRFRLPGSEAEAERQLEEATAGVWIPERIRVFVSHTHAHRQVVAATP